jgi:hypothetical protein
MSLYDVVISLYDVVMSLYDVVQSLYDVVMSLYDVVQSLYDVVQSFMMWSCHCFMRLLSTPLFLSIFFFLSYLSSWHIRENRPTNFLVTAFEFLSRYNS